MMNFEYRAACVDGSVVTGNLTGINQRDVIQQLRALGQIPIRIDESTQDSRPKSSRLSFRRRKVSDRDVADITRELAILLRAGMPVDSALGVLTTLAENPALATMLDDIRDEVKGGSSLADAVARHDQVFDRLYINLLRAGESGGALEVVLERLAEHLDRNYETRSTVQSALIYPLVLVFVAISSVFILLGYVVPQFTEMFESAGAALPTSTRITIAAGNFLQSWGWLLITACVLGGLFIKRQLAQDATAYRWHNLALSLPLAGTIIIKNEVSRFARTLATLLQNGIPILKALAIVKDTMSNRVLADGLDEVVNRMSDGQSLAEPLKATRFPAFAVQMIRVGEESGSLSEILMQVAETYDRDTQVTIKRSLALLEPVLILVLGALIAGVIISILVAILGVNELVI